MSSIGVTLADYANQPLNGFGQQGQNVLGTSSAGDVANLAKAISAGDTTGRDTTGLTNASGAPLKVESLEASLKYLTYKMRDIRLYPLLPKSAAFNTVEEYNQVVSFGNDGGGFIPEGGLPESEDSVYRRLAQHVKFMGNVREVTHPMTLTRTQAEVGSIIERETQAGIMWLLKKVNHALAYADSSIVPDEFNGIYAQHRAAALNVNDYHAQETVIDMRGSHITQEIVMDAVDTVIDNHGYASQLIGSHKTMSDISKQFLQAPYGGKRMENNVTGATVGQRVNSIAVQNGDIGLNFDKFLTAGAAKTTATAATSSNAPSNPTLATAAVGSDAQSVFEAADAGDYLYAVTSLNRFGESGLGAAAAVTVATGGAVDLTITNAGGGSTPTGYQVYRTKKNDTGAGAKFYPLYKVSTADVAAGYDSGGVGVVRDKNRWLPDTNQAWMFDNDRDVIEVKQLAPMMKMDLALLSTSYRFMVLNYLTPILYTPNKTIRFINVGKFA
jgi:hypothetical protein